MHATFSACRGHRSAVTMRCAELRCASFSFLQFDTVADIMTTGAKVFTCRADDSVDKGGCAAWLPGSEITQLHFDGQREHTRRGHARTCAGIRGRW